MIREQTFSKIFILHSSSVYDMQPCCTEWEGEWDPINAESFLRSSNVNSVSCYNLPKTNKLFTHKLDGVLTKI